MAIAEDDRYTVFKGFAPVLWLKHMIEAVREIKKTEYDEENEKEWESTFY